MFQYTRFRFYLISFFVTVSLSGCKLTNPYVDESTLVTSNNYSNRACRPLESDPEQALICASQLRTEYVNAMGQQAELTSITGLGLIPLTALTIGFAANGESATKISDFALGSAGIYSLSSWLSSPEQSRIFALGHQAVQCAEQASMPFLSANKRNKELEASSSEKGMANYVSELNAAISAAETLFPPTSQSPIAQQFVTAKAQAAEVRQQATGLITRLNGAPAMLVTNVQRINSAVNLALTDSVQSLSTLPGILSGMGDLYTNNKTFFTGFVPVSEASGDGDSSITAEGGTPQEQAAREQIEMSSVEAIIQATGSLRYYLETMTPPLATKSLESCGIDLTELSTTLKATPAILEFTSGIIVHSVAINGGNGKYGFQPSSELFEIKQNTSFGGVFAIKLKSDDVLNGNYFIKFEDATGRTIDVPVAVKTAKKEDKETQPETGSNQDGASICTSTNKTLVNAEKNLCSDSAKTLALQQMLNDIDGISLNPDGVFGTKTREAIIAFIDKYAHLIGEISTETLQAIDDYTYEQALPEADLNQYLMGIGVAPDQSDKFEKVMIEQDNLDIPATGFVGADLLPLVGN